MYAVHARTAILLCISMRHKRLSSQAASAVRNTGEKERRPERPDMESPAFFQEKIKR
jgi:hypothetical protein